MPKKSDKKEFKTKKKPIIIANWKMNLGIEDSRRLVKDLKKSLKGKIDSDVVVCPSFPFLSEAAKTLPLTKIFLGSQDVFWQRVGSYTGEVSPDVLEEIGCTYAIVGHSERRMYQGETDETVNKKIKVCIDGKIIPILCVGETFDERQDGQANNKIYSQLKKALANVDLVPGEELIVAYEPVWAIGSGRLPEAEEVEDMFKNIVQALRDCYPASVVSNSIRLVYGGSIDAEISQEYWKIGLLDGFLVGGASLKSGEFTEIIKGAKLKKA